MRLIDADAFIVDSIKERRFVFHKEDLLNDEIVVKTVYGDLMDAINNAPTVDAEPVRHGEWGSPEIVGYDGVHVIYAAPCSVCCKHTELYKPNYCPNCGAKMNGWK